jgi:glycosyltransferase involved in cell wall biosynthesis
MPDVLVVTSLIPKMLGAKVILDQHDPMPELMMTIFGVDERNWAVRLLAWLEKWSIARVDQVVTVNIACKRLFSQRSCPPEKIGIVMNCPDTTIFPFRAPESYSFPCREARKPFVIMYHGSLVERNGLDLAVDALEAVRESVPNAELRIYGKRTPFLDRVMEKVNHKRLSGSVLYLGPKKLEDLVAEITQCDVGVIPNHNNPFTEINTPTRIFEYLALGKPVIAPRTPGIQDYFSSDSLYFFEAGDPQDLSRRIEEAYSDSSRARATAERGQQVYLAHQWSSESRALVAMIEQLLHGDRRN